MSDALLVLNAGSSSLKFSVFLDEDPPRPLLRGQIEGLLTSPRFAARDAGNPDRRAGVASRHAARPSGRDRVPLRVGPERRARRPPHRRRRPSRRPWRHAVRGAGARRCRGDRGAGGVDSAGSAAPAAQRGRDHGGGADGAGVSRRSPASIRRFTGRSRPWRRPLPCRAAMPTREYAATAFMACPTNTSRRSLRTAIVVPRPGAPWSHTWATAPACAR